MISRLRRRVLLLSLLLSLLPAACWARELTVMTSGGYTAALARLAPAYGKQTGVEVETVHGPSMGATPQSIPTRLKNGEHADLVIMVGSALQQLIDQGLVDPASRVEIADSRIGLVVRHGAPKPAIDSVQALKQTLLDARSVAYSDSASGVYIERTLFKRLGIEPQMTPKSRKIERIPVASVVADGQYQLGFQQVAELLPIQGADFVGRIPEQVQSITRYAAGIPVGAQHRHEAEQLLRYLQSPEAAAIAEQTGLDSVAR